MDKCIKCESKNIDKATRVIGYLKRIKDFSNERQKEADVRFYHKWSLSNIKSPL